VLTPCGSGGSRIVLVEEIEIPKTMSGGGVKRGCPLPIGVESRWVIRFAIARGPVLLIYCIS